MIENSFKNRLKKLSLTRKMILLGTLAGAIGVFLPWYKDIDRHNTGDMFLGITGPLYLAGIVTLLAFSISFAVIALQLFEKKPPKLPLKENQFFVFSSSLAIFMLVLANSVYFHNKFGINLTHKSVGIGMIMAFLGGSLALFGGILSSRKNEVDFENEGSLEPLIDMEIQDRVQNTLGEKDDDPVDRMEKKPVNTIPVQESIETNEIKINE